MTKRLYHIPVTDWGTHVVTLCGRFRRSLDDCFGNAGVCKKCRMRFTRTPAEIAAEIVALRRLGESFNFSKTATECPNHPGIVVPTGGTSCWRCSQEWRKVAQVLRP